MRRVSRKSLKKAIKHLQTDEKSDNHENHHKIGKRSAKQVTSFSRNLILNEIKAHVSRGDWRVARELFPSLLRQSVEIEPLIWRYALIIALYSDSSALNVTQFLENCVGSLDAEKTAILRNFLLMTSDSLS